MELLVKELLEHNGFQKAEILSKKAFSEYSDADIIASSGNLIDEYQYLIQVKHHGGNSGCWGIEQLKKIKELLPVAYRDHKLVLVTTGTIDDNTKKLAEESDVIVIDGEELMEWIFDSMDKLLPATKSALGIESIPTVIPVNE